MAEVLAVLQSLFPTAVTGGGLFGIYVYFRKIDAAIKDDLRKTIDRQATEIEKLWAELWKLRGLPADGKDSADSDGGS